MSALPPTQIAVGIDGSDSPDVIRELAAAGADEFFAGYVPQQWSDTYGWEIGLNRRTFGPDYQFASLTDLEAAIAAAHAVGAPVFITFNAHDYHADQVPLLRTIVLDVCALSPDALIVADPALLELLGSWGVTTPVHLSVGAGCFNGAAVRHFCRIADVRRVVLPRKMSLPEMAAMIEGLSDLGLDYEALVIGYRCLFNDEFCFTRHSGVSELFCGSFVPDPDTPAYRRLPADWKDVAEQAARAADEQFRPGSALDRFCKARGQDVRPSPSAVPRVAADGLDGGVAAALFSNCALCTIPGLRRAGVGVLKVPVRGTAWQRRRYLAVVRQVADHPDPTPAFCRGLIASPGFCDAPGSCYYAKEPGTGVPSGEVLSVELALYLSDLDDLLHLEEGLRNSGSFDIPQFIFASMFGDDPGAQEYIGNLVAAEWLENYLAAGHTVSRLYFGQEFCEFLIPSRDDLERAVSVAASSDLAFTYVTGYVTDAGLAATRRNLEWLAEHAAGSEVVFNDWGVLALLSDEFTALVPVLGRLLIKQQRMARFTVKAPPVNLRGINTPQAAVIGQQISALRQLNLSIPEYRRRLQDEGVARFDLDIVPQGVDLPKDAWGFGVSCYYPWGYVTGSRNCYTAGMLDPERDYVVTGTPCPAPCRLMNRGAKVLHFPQPPVQRGNSVFIYHAHYATPYWNGEIPVDRIVFEPWIPV